AEQEGQQTETEATGAPQKHHYTLNQQVGSITCVAGFVLPPGAYLRHLHHSDGSSSQGKFNLSDLFSTRNGF
ncbi:hypothetical protein, partial [Klebsiella quasipneumoniae]|uniref:hypothetical protein n=1 Tax=Klebsiella quasipneumoniae TaxID=1463165 RepID=UPI001C6F859D